MRTGEPLPSVGDVLAALATGLWHWDTATGLVSVDAEAARLLGLPPESATLTEAQTRARLHPVDWNEITGVVQLAAAEGTLAEVRIRIMDPRGTSCGSSAAAPSRPSTPNGGRTSSSAPSRR